MYQLIDGFLDVVGIFFIVYLIEYSTFLFLSVVVGSIQLYRQHRQRRLQNYLPNDYHMPISIIVPAWNEAVTVVATVHSLLNLEYQAYEVIVVDDGSEDDTSQTLIEAFNMHAVHRPIRRQVPCQPEEFIYETRTQKVPVTVIRKKNGGKADSLKKIVQPMLDRHVVAVGGLVRIANDVELEHGRVKKYRLPRNLLACMQVLEYDRSFLASRILFDQFNGSLIISGAFGLFRKDVVIAAGGYNVSTLGEDMELVVKLHEYCTVNRMDYCIRYATDAICWTQAPERLSDLKKQRRRWHLGLFQSMMKHRGILFNPQFGAVSFISYFYFLVYELLSPVIEIFGVATMVLAWFSGLINVRFMVLLFLIYVLFGVVLSLTAFFARMYTADLRVSFADMMKAVLLCFFEITCLRFVLTWVRATAFFGYRKSRLQWGSMKRKTINYN